MPACGEMQAEFKEDKCSSRPSEILAYHPFLSRFESMLDLGVTFAL